MKVTIFSLLALVLLGLVALPGDAWAANGHRCEIRRRLDDPVGGDYRPINAANQNNEAALGHYIMLRGFIFDTAGGDASAIGSNWKWSLDGDPIRGYTFTLPRGEKLGAPDKKQRDVNFYWYKDPKAREVALKVDANGKTIKAPPQTITVRRPSSTTITTVTDAVRARNFLDAAGAPNGTGTLIYGDTPAPPDGITWTGTTTSPVVNSPNPLNGNGNLAYVQLIVLNREQTLNSGTVQEISSGGKFVLDRVSTGLSPRYNDAQTAIASGASATHVRSDTPRTALSLDITKKSANEKFRNYLMYRPDGANSIFVSLARVDWHWKGETVRAGNTWGNATNVSSANNPSGSDESDLPEWRDFQGRLIDAGFVNK